MEAASNRGSWLKNGIQGLRLDSWWFSILQGLFAACLIVFWIHINFLQTGWNFLLLSSLLAGFTVGLWLCNQILFLKQPRLRPVYSGLLILFVSSCPLWFDVSSTFLREVGEQSWFWAVIRLAAMVLLTFVYTCLLASCVIPDRGFQNNSSQQPTRFVFWLAISCGICLTAGILAPSWPIYYLAISSAAGLFCLMLFQTAMETFRFEHDQELSSSSYKAEQIPGPVWLGYVEIFLWCGLIPVLYRMMCQLQAETSLLSYGTLSALVLGFGWASAFKVKNSPVRPLFVCIVAACLFPVWMQYYLYLSASVSSIHLAMMLRGLGVFCFFTPIGFALGQNWHRVGSSIIPERANRFQMFLGTASCLLGVSVTFWMVALGEMTITLIVLFALLLMLSLMEAKNQIFNFSQFRLAKVFPMLTYCIAIVCLGLLPWTYSPAGAARMLFSTPVFHAWRNGIQLNEISGLDDGRLLKTVDSSAGTLTYWRYQGSHVQIRKNGIPAGRISQTDYLVPQPTGGVLSVVLPMSLHEAPRHVCLIGLEAGLGAKTILDFPVIEVDCVESNQEIVNQCRAGVLEKTLDSVFADERFQLHHSTAEMKTVQDEPRYDVIIELPGHSAVYSHAISFQQQHYQKLKNQLASGGIYCQRFTYTDYGPDILKSLTQTMQDTFGYVTAFDTAPGEMLFVAAENRDVIFKPDFITRLSSPQVRRSLARIGWDWSVVMNLARFEVEDLEKASGYGPQNPWLGISAFRLPVEMMRWGNKFGEVRQLLANRPKRLLEYYADDKQAEDVLKRLSDIAAREQVLTRHTDQFWVYRKSLKQRLQEKPRTIIEPVKGEGLQQKIHPEDQFRLDYFEALGKASQASPCLPELLEQVEDYAAPYDPMVSYFLHPEMARLYQRCQPAMPDRELAHWLHTLYFGSQHERSVRSIHRALELLSNAEVKLSAAQKYDHTSTLLELLKIRWGLRRGKQDIAQQVLLLDLQNSLNAARLAFDAMDKWGQQAGIEESEIQARQLMLEKSLTLMLKSYRVEILARASRPHIPIPDELQNNSGNVVQ